MSPKRKEGKNGYHKRTMKISNNSKNVLWSMANNENQANGLRKEFGWFKPNDLSVVQMSDEISEFTTVFHEEINEILQTGDIVVNKISYKNTTYHCDGKTCVLVHANKEKTSFLFGIMTKIILRKSFHGEIIITRFHVLHCFSVNEKSCIFKFG